MTNKKDNAQRVGSASGIEGAHSGSRASNAEIPVADQNLINHIEMRFSVFRDIQAQAVDQRPASWDELVGILSSPKERASKDTCELIKLATFGDRRSAKGAIRNNDNVQEIYGVEGDYDGEQTSVDQACTLLAQHQIEALIYTSPSHTEERPRWRVLAPLSTPRAPEEREGLVAMLNWALGGILARESFTLSQIYYFGKVAGVSYQARRVHGVPLDVLELTGNLGEAYPAGESKPKASREAVNSEVMDFERTVTLAAVTDETIKELRSALEVLSKADADEYLFWIEFGQALKSVAQAGREEEALTLWHEFSAKSGKYDADECNAKWESFAPDRISYRSIFEWAAARGWVNPRSAEALKANATAATRLDRTDAGNVALLAQVTAGNLRFVPEYKIWLWWSGERWERDDYGIHCMAAALQVAEHYHRKANEIRKQAESVGLDDQERKNVERAAKSMEEWANRCRNKGSLDNMLSLAKSDPRFTLPADRLDRDPWLFGVDNGVVDLRSGALRPAGRDDLVTKRSPVRFDPTARAPRWLQFIEEITATPLRGATCGYRARPALSSYMQRALGYSMTGRTAEHKMFMAIGEGSNGKNVLLDLWQWIAGDYCQTIAPEALMASRYDADAERATPGARKLAGARAAISSESKDGQRLDVALVKRHTGGGYMTARGLHENAFTFEITHKLWLMTNHRPALDHMDEAMRGRLHMIPFDMRWNRPGHPDRDSMLPDGDKTLPDKLKVEAEGVLAWLVEGAVAYSSDGLEPPDEVVRMTRDYFKDQDPVGLWLETCEPCEHRHGGLAKELLDAFRCWCSREGFLEGSVMSAKTFSQTLKARGIESHRGNAGMRYGLRAQILGLT